MFTDDRDGVKRITVGVLAGLLILGGLFLLLWHVNADNQRTNRSRIEACKTIRDERFRDDCLTGGYYVGGQDGGGQ